jgi:hypothetical protein
MSWWNLGEVSFESERITVRIQFLGWKASIGQVIGGLDDSFRGGVGVMVGDVVAIVGLGVDGVMVTTAVLYTVVVIQYVMPASGSSPDPLQKKLGSSGCNPSAALPEGNGVIMELCTISSPSTALTSTSSTQYAVSVEGKSTTGNRKKE